MKIKQPRSKLNRQILDEASAWFVDFRVGDVDSAARERFDRWLRQSPEHIRAYMEIAKTYVDLPAPSPQREIDVQEMLAAARRDGNVVPFADRVQRHLSDTPATAPIHSPQASSGTPGRRRPRMRAMTLAASIAIAGTVSLSLLFVLNRSSTYTTQIGERRSITLADGSTIDLNSRSEVRISYSKTQRDVELIEGQALFEVAKDKRRPFVVRSGDTLMRAVGTQFDVYRKQNDTIVTVVEGRVAVLQTHSSPGREFDQGGAPFLHDGAAGIGIPKTAGPGSVLPYSLTGRDKQSAPVFVSAGEQVTVTDQAIAAPAPADVAVAIAWVQHRLVFDASRLSDVIDDFNRYNARQIHIEDKALDDFHVSGVYSSTDPASLLRFLRSQAHIDVVETDREVRIARK